MTNDDCEHGHDCVCVCQDCRQPLEYGDLTYYHRGGCPRPRQDTPDRP